MHDAKDYLAGLGRLHTLDSLDERRSMWRQGLATLASAAANQQPTPLEGLAPDMLAASLAAALESGLLDDLGWLSRPVAAAALFEIGAALPAGNEKREVGRRVLKALNEGDAVTFVTLAQMLALGTRRGLAGAAVRARVALSLRLPVTAGSAVDGLALALMSRPELEREWVGTSSIGALSSRRLAAHLIERAAREATRRAAEGDDSGMRVLDRPSVKLAWTRLLNDRESLVWRHVAAARGLLASAAPVHGAEIDRELGPKQTPTEWRRAAASLAASIAHSPESALARCREILAGELLKRDPGVAAAMAYGLARAGDQEPEAAEELLGDLMLAGDVDTIEALVDLRREHAGAEFGSKAAATAVARIQGSPKPKDDGLAALMEALAADLGPAASAQPTLRSRIVEAVAAFSDGRAVAPAVELALAAAETAIAALERSGDGSDERRKAFKALRELDLGLLETSTLGDLVVIAGSEAAGQARLAGILERLGAWILSREESPLPEGPVEHPTLRLRRLRTLLHLLDADSVPGEDAAGPGRERRLRAFRVLAGRAAADPPSPLRRTLCAALARASDGLIRDDVVELSDVVVAIADSVEGEKDLRILAEASMAPDVKAVFAAMADLARALAGATADASGRGAIEAFRGLAESLPPGTSARVEGLRRALLGVARSLEAVADARALGDMLAGETSTVLDRLIEATQYSAQLVVGARRRLGQVAQAQADGPRAAAGPALRALESAIDRALRDLDDELPARVAAAVAALRTDLPKPLAAVIAHVLGRVPALPAEASHEGEGDGAGAAERRLRLPPWLPPSRLLGGFHVQRPIGAGGGASVFVACRAEERHDEQAETFALKIPSYDGSAAHTLSEEEFMKLFREEAGALLTLPQHTNLAGFVTFDAGARPKPILVMELVQGPTLERLIERQEMSVPLAMTILDGVAAGLGAMHALGLGHLDVKPANIILRIPRVSAATRVLTMHSAAPVPVLVDFGLAGRKVRPGCASPFYGAPEVWDVDGGGRGADPRAADVYAYACLAYELLLGQTLFQGDNLPALVAAHLGHDGFPPALAALKRRRDLAVLADVLAAGLARDPARRLTVADLQRALSGLARTLEPRAWPLAA